MHTDWEWHGQIAQWTEGVKISKYSWFCPMCVCVRNKWMAPIDSPSSALLTSIFIPLIFLRRKERYTRMRSFLILLNSVHAQYYILTPSNFLMTQFVCDSKYFYFTNNVKQILCSTIQYHYPKSLPLLKYKLVLSF